MRPVCPRKKRRTAKQPGLRVAGPFPGTSQLRRKGDRPAPESSDRRRHGCRFHRRIDRLEEWTAAASPLSARPPPVPHPTRRRVSQNLENTEDVHDPAPRRRRKREHKRRLTRRGKNTRACIVVPLAVVVIWATVSYSIWMLRPSSLSWSVNSVEWVRYDIPFGIGNWAADHVEQAYYARHTPKKGGPQLKSLPKVGVRQPTTPTTTPVAAWPPPIAPIFPSPLPGEGTWQPTGPPVDGGAPILVTTYRPDPTYPQIVAYVAWFNHARPSSGITRVALSRRTQPSAVRRWSLTASAPVCSRPSMAGSPMSTATTGLRTTASRTSH